MSCEVARVACDNLSAQEKSEVMHSAQLGFGDAFAATGGVELVTKNLATFAAAMRMRPFVIAIGHIYFLSGRDWDVFSTGTSALFSSVCA
jgi:hypothetical protein